MSVYGKRQGPAYEQAGSVPDEWAENKHILRWWTEEHDQVVCNTIDDWQWNWFWKVTDALVKITPEEALSRWQKEDRLCRKFAWGNILMNFAQARAQVLGFTSRVRPPERRACGLCGTSFTEDSLPMPVVERLGMSRLDICSPCVEGTVFNAGRSTVTEEEVLEYIRRLAESAGRAAASQDLLESRRCRCKAAEILGIFAWPVLECKVRVGSAVRY